MTGPAHDSSANASASCERTAPFGRPVLPLVYKISAGVGSAASGIAGPRGWRPLPRCGSPPPPDPKPAVCWRERVPSTPSAAVPAPALASCAVAETSDDSTSSVGARSARITARSSPLRSGSRGATVAPSFQPPRSATAKVQRLGIATAIRSPARTPRSLRRSANASARRWSSAYVSAPPFQRSAALSGPRRAVASRRRTKLATTGR